ncbi:MAG: twin-arginine translocase subunit TatC [Gammaproteobacteria bacterium]
MSNTESECEKCNEIMAHLLELRTRLIRCTGVFFIAFASLYVFSAKLYTTLTAPLLSKLPEDGHLIATNIAAPFLAPLKLTFAVSLFITIPFILQQIWRFIAPGLYDNERNLARGLLLASIGLFYVGMMFAYIIVFPLVLGFFARIVPEGVAFIPDISAYLNFALKLLFAFGIAFQVPVITILCIASGLVNIQSLANKRPYVIVMAFIAGMLLTPPDIVSQLLLAIPMWLLFEGGILFARLFLRHKLDFKTNNPDLYQ